MADDDGPIPLAPPGQRTPVLMAPAAPAVQDGPVPLLPPGQRNIGQQTGGGGQQSGQTGGGQTQQATGPGWGVDWSKGGQGTMPQSGQDWDAVATNEARAYGLPGLRAQAEAAKQRMDPVSAASANFAGAAL